MDAVGYLASRLSILTETKTGGRIGRMSTHQYQWDERERVASSRPERQLPRNYHLRAGVRQLHSILSPQAMTPGKQATSRL